MGPSLTRDEETIETVEIPRFSAFQGSQGDGLHFLGCRSAVGGLPRQGSHYNADLMRPLREKIKQDSAWKADKSALPPGQCTGTQVHNGHGCYPDMDSNLSKDPPYPDLAPSDYYTLPEN